jgi:hypothetical protein
MLHDHNQRNVLAHLFVPPFIGHAFNIVTRGRLSMAPTITMTKRSADGSRTPSKRSVPVARAPHPSDLWWNNTVTGGKAVVKRRAMAWGIYVGLLVLSLLTMTWLTSEAIGEKIEKMQVTRLQNLPAAHNVVQTLPQPTHSNSTRYSEERHEPSILSGYLDPTAPGIELRCHGSSVPVCKRRVARVLFNPNL